MKTFFQRVAKRIGLYEAIAFTTGFVLMAFELVASRILAPAIGTSTYVWTSVIGVMIAALAVGYATGGWIADRRERRSDIAWLLMLAAVTILTTCTFYDDTLTLIVRTVHDPRIQGVIAATFLFAPASFLMGMTSPYLAKLRVASIQTTGRSVASLSAANSFGGIAGTFCTGFIFFTIIGSRETLILLAAVLLLCGLTMTVRGQQKLRALVIVGLSATALLTIAVPAQAGVVADIDTPASRYKVIDTKVNNQPTRVLIMGPSGLQSGSYLSGSKDLVFSYPRKMAEVVAAMPHKKRILILGGGAFSLPEYFGRHYPDSQVDVAEIDPALPGIAQKYFNYQQPANVHVTAQDARIFLASVTNPYDIIIFDAYNDLSLPFSLATREYAAALKAALRPDGAVIANIIAADNPQCSPLLSRLQASYKTAFKNAQLYPLGDPTLKRRENIIGLYTNTDLDWAQSVPGATNIAIASADALIDNHAPIEYLQQQCE